MKTRGITLERLSIKSFNISDTHVLHFELITKTHLFYDDAWFSDFYYGKKNKR